ncbi:MAG: hypothetical protein WBR24_21335 [Desulfobacterales bacterium]|jgi:hypothetical protein
MKITAGHIPFHIELDRVLAEGMDEIGYIEELVWEFSDLDQQRYFESEGDRHPCQRHLCFCKYTKCLE